MASKEVSPRAETVCPPENEGMHPPIKGESYLHRNKFTVFRPDVALCDTVQNVGAGSLLKFGNTLLSRRKCCKSQANET